MLVRTHGQPLAVLVAGLLCLAGCDEDTAAPEGPTEEAFEATLFTDGQGMVEDPACGAPPRVLNTQLGEGTSPHLDAFTILITFCMDVTDFLDDGTLTAGESLPYDSGVGTLVAANGDELYIEIAGAVVPSDDPAFDFEFHDPFVFTGGTGAFEGASGEGMSDSFVTQATGRTEHTWSGTLVLPGGP